MGANAYATGRHFAIYQTMVLTVSADPHPIYTNNPDVTHHERLR